MNEKKFLELFNKKNVEHEWRPMLDYIEDRNNNFAVECLMNLKNNELDQMEQILDNQYHFKAALTDIIVKLNIREQLICQISKYIIIWNLFNKILETEEEKREINDNIQVFAIRFPAIKIILGYLYYNSRENCENISKAIYLNLDIVTEVLSLLCNKDIVYKISIENQAVYDLTEHGRIWVEKNMMK